MKNLADTLAGCLLAVLVLASAGRAQDISEIPLRPAGTSAASPLEEHILYRQSNLDDRGLNRAIDQVAVPTLTIYRPATAQRGTAIIVCPGGGYQMVVIDREGHFVARFLQRHGITAVVLKYRLPAAKDPGADLPLPQQDALAAIRYVRQHADTLGVGVRRIGVLGFSAGGHLAGSTAVFGRADDGSLPDFVAMIYPVVTMSGPFAHAASRRNLLGENPSAERVRQFSLEQQVREVALPFFIAHAQDDPVVPPENSRQLAAALARAGAPVRELRFATGQHGFALGRDADSSRWPDAFLAWLDQLPLPPLP